MSQTSRPTPLNKVEINVDPNQADISFSQETTTMLQRQAHDERGISDNPMPQATFGDEEQDEPSFQEVFSPSQYGSPLNVDDAVQLFSDQGVSVTQPLIGTIRHLIQTKGIRWDTRDWSIYIEGYLSANVLSTLPTINTLLKTLENATLTLGTVAAEQKETAKTMTSNVARMTDVLNKQPTVPMPQRITQPSFVAPIPTNQIATPVTSVTPSTSTPSTINVRIQPTGEVVRDGIKDIMTKYPKLRLDKILVDARVANQLETLSAELISLDNEKRAAEAIFALYKRYNS